MKTKGELTREMIIVRAAHVFNTRGYFGTSIADIVAETGLERGGIYNHFANKDELALAAFDYAASLRGKLILERSEHVANAADRLIIFAQVALEILESADMPGGCPVLNTAVEADDTHPALKARAQASLRHLQQIVETTVDEGISRGEIRPSAHPSTLATLMVAALEGGMMMSKLNDSSLYLQVVIDYWTQIINSEVRA